MGERGKRFLGSSGLKLFLSLAVAGHAWISAAALLVCMTGGFQGCDGQHCSLERLSGGAQGCNGLPGSSSASVPGRSCPALSSSPSFPGQLIRAVLEGEILVVAVSCLPRLANAAVVVGVWPWGSWGQYPGVSAVIPEVEERLGMRRRDLEPPFSQNDTSAERKAGLERGDLEEFSHSCLRLCSPVFVFLHCWRRDSFIWVFLFHPWGHRCFRLSLKEIPNGVCDSCCWVFFPRAGLLNFAFTQ
ncbi:uncharacterized protein LOC120754407 isoform X1 [Hirundo rustica]|uniref:uncharacterized protein LOC120754407 isoform X1 n=1 Tax=Hirundo rustica TaxID=43150 RepID=UPI001A94E56C|nr:uncharacterized protein LOC120754407 isoform X1 [Hirundo rustica]